MTTANRIHHGLALSRRDFLKSTALVSGGLLLGLQLPGGPREARASATVHAPNAWVHIAEDGGITLISARSEMGQGVYTSMPMLIAEELNVDPRQVQVAIAPPGEAYRNALLGAQITGGSTSVRDGWERLRIAGAQVREMLIAAAATRWGLSAAELRAEDGRILAPDGRSAGYGELAQAAARLPVPEHPPIKPAAEFRVVGQRLARLDTPAKVNGSAEFGIDVQLPGMVHAALTQCPVIGGRVKSLDDTRARAMPGVIDIVRIDDGVAVVAEGWWQAKQACDALEIDWDPGPGAELDDARLLATTRAALDQARPLEITSPRGDVQAALAAARRVISAEYITPMQAHAPIEPMNFTAQVDDDQVLLIGPTQFQQGAQGAVATALGVAPEAVRLRTTFLGGGFGRRLEIDYVVQAAQIARAVKRPVKLIWTREEDMTHDFYRPVAINRLRAALDDTGRPQALHFQVASQSITQRAFGLAPDTLDPFMTEAAVAPCAIPNTRHDLIIHDTGMRVGYWRAVSHNMNCFANESFIDELAAAAGQDPYAYRRALLAGQPRFLRVLDLAAERAGWKDPAPAGRARGLAIMEGYDTYMAQIVEVSLGPDGAPRVHRITVTADPGRMVNPAIVEAQIESGIVFGLGAALKHRVTLKNGRIQEQNYDRFEPLRMHEVPEIDIALIDSDAKPGGIGEPSTAVVGPALANAVARLTGKRLRQLPITAQALREA